MWAMSLLYTRRVMVQERGLLERENTLQPEDIVEVDTRNGKVTQANALAKSAQEMTLFEKRLILLAIACITRDDEDFSLQRIPISAMERAFHTNTKAIYSIVRSTAQKLMKRTIEVDDGKDGWTIFQWASRVRYVPGHLNDTSFSHLELQLHEDLKPFLLKLKQDFNSIPLAEMLAIPSFNSVRLFEILWHDSHALKRPQLRYKIPDLKVRLGLANKYKKFKDFKYVLDRAQEHCEEVTSMAFSYHGIRTGRAYTHVHFVVQKNHRFQVDLPQLPNQASHASTKGRSEPTLTPEQQALAQDMTEVGYQAAPEEIFAKYSNAEVRESLRMVNSAINKSNATKNPVRNPGGLFVTFLANGAARRSLENNKQQGAQATRDIQEFADTVLRSFEQERAKHIDLLWNELSEDEQHAVHDLMRAETTRFVINKIEEAGWQGVIYEGERRRVMERFGYVEFSDQLNDVDQFVDAFNVLEECDITMKKRVLAEVKQQLKATS